MWKSVNWRLIYGVVLLLFALNVLGSGPVILLTMLLEQNDNAASWAIPIAFGLSMVWLFSISLAFLVIVRMLNKDITDESKSVKLKIVFYRFFGSCCAMIVVFTGIYFSMACYSDYTDTIHYGSGYRSMHAAPPSASNHLHSFHGRDYWRSEEGTFLKGKIEEGIYLFTDSLYHSTITLSTVGYGSSSTHFWYVKLATRLEALSGVFILALSMGSYVNWKIKPTEKSAFPNG